MDSCFIDGEGLVDCKCFGDVLIFSFAVLMDLGSHFRTSYDVSPSQVANKLLLMAFVQVETVGLKADQCRKFKSSVLVFVHKQTFSCSHNMDG